MRRFFAVLLLLALSQGTAPGQAPEPGRRDIEVTADNFVMDESIREAVFTGSVVVKHPNVTVWAPEVVIHYGEGGTGDIRSFTAQGGPVRLQTPNQVATGERAVFDPKTQVLRLTGNVAVNNEAGTLTGSELVVNLVDNTSVFTSGNGGRVTGVFVSP